MKRDRFIALVVFLLPGSLLYAGFFLLPMAQAFYVALFRWRGFSLNRQFVGIENFRKLFTDDPVFWQCLLHNLTFLVAGLIVIIPLGLLFAVALSSKMRGAGFYRAVYLFPNVISIVAVAVLWTFVYHPSFGILNAFAKGPQAGWLGEPRTALPSVIVASMWYSLGFYIVLFLAGVQSIPRTFYEAAEIDGAAAWQSFVHITLPLLWEVLRLAIVYLIIQTLGVFGLVWIMTAGGPSNHTETLLTYLYRLAFVESNFGYATAVGVVVFFVILAISLTSQRLMKRETVEL